MGVDAFIAYYGVRYEVPDTDEAIEQHETGEDPLYKRVRQAKLKAHFGRMTDGEPYFIYVGMQLGWLGVENDTLVSYDQTDLDEIIKVTDEKLDQAGFEGERKLWLQLAAQY